MLSYPLPIIPFNSTLRYMKKKFKFENKHYGMRCTVPYIYTLTIVGYIPEKKMVRLMYSFGQYERHEFFVPEEDIILDPKELSPLNKETK